MLKEHQDAYGQEIYDYWRGKNQLEIIERIDGFIQASPIPANYFAEFENWPVQEQEAIGYARGRVLDIGCGAGRVGLYLQQQGCEVHGIDNSPLALEVCRLRGLKNLYLMPITKISPTLGQFDTMVMFGNNFGLFGSYRRAKWLLRKFRQITSLQARILASSRDVYQTEDPAHLAYHEFNRRQGRMAGQLRLRVRYRNYTSPWFDYLIVSQDEMKNILEGTGWEVTRFIDTVDSPSYVAVIQKTG